MIEVHRYLIISAMFLLFVAPLRFHAQPAKGRASERSIRPVLVNTCVVTENVKRLVGFYEPILGEKAKWSGDNYAEFATGMGVLAIFSSSAQEEYIPGSAEAAKNQSVILEFKVADVDAEYRRLRGMVKTWVKPPTTQPWGTRSIYFRDPDGNLVDFYSPAPAPESRIHFPFAQTVVAHREFTENRSQKKSSRFGRVPRPKQPEMGSHVGKARSV